MSAETGNSATKVLILPGIGGSSPAHWQSLWEKKNPSFMRVMQDDWNNPVCEQWLTALDDSVKKAGSNVVLVAHSLGCILVANWAALTTCQVKAALLVAPPDPDGPNFPKAAVGFAPVALETFRFPCIIVASSNDPYASLIFGKSCASAWGSRFVSIGAAGHINTNSGLGEWPEGFSLLQELVV